jgi:hypothetical protein
LKGLKHDGHGGAEYQHLLPHHLKTHVQSGQDKRGKHFENVQKRNRDRAKLEEDISKTALDPTAHKHLVSRALRWRMIEMAAVVSSLIGLIIAILDYELCMFYDGYAGIKTLPDQKIKSDGSTKIADHDILWGPV